MDHALVNDYFMTEVIRCMHIGLLCVQDNPEDRPTMDSVVLMLNDDSISIPVPQRPSFFSSCKKHKQAPCVLNSDQSTSKVSQSSSKITWLGSGTEIDSPYVSSTQEKVGKMSYGALTTRILHMKRIAILDKLKKEKLVNLEIGRETLKKMKSRPTSDGWMNLKDEIVEIRDGDYEAAKDALNGKLKEKVDMGKKRKQKEPVSMQKQTLVKKSSANIPKMEKAKTRGEFKKHKTAEKDVPAISEL